MKNILLNIKLFVIDQVKNGQISVNYASKKYAISRSSISSDPREHSELMEDDAFDYPSEYHSESEQSIGVEIEYINGKLVLKKKYMPLT